MIYEISPKYFGLTTARQVLFAAGSLLCFMLVVFVPSWISASDPWRARDVLTAFICWFSVEIQWYLGQNYSIEVEETSIRSGRQLVRKGRIRYLREIDGLIRGRRLEVSEQGLVLARLFGGRISIPKGLPDYEQIKTKISTWVAVNTELT